MYKYLFQEWLVVDNIETYYDIEVFGDSLEDAKQEAIKLARVGARIVLIKEY